MPAATQLDNPPASRLVIRVKLATQEVSPPPPPATPRLNKHALLAAVGIAAVAGVGWLAYGSFKDEPARAPVAITAPRAVEPKPVEPEVQPQPDAPLAAVNQVMPDVSQSALDTIRGTVRVSVRALIDKQGTVVKTVTEDRGPSRYFERMAVGAAKQWTFTPANQAERREMLLKFSFTKYGATAAAEAQSSG